MMRRLAPAIVFFLTVCFCYAVPGDIMSEGRLSENFLVDFLLEKNPGINRTGAENIVRLYICETNAEGVNYEIALAQMFYHTNFLTFSGTFAGRGSNNFYGCSTYNNHRIAHNFNSVQEGVRAHVQHLKGYASSENLSNGRVDPRYQRIAEMHGLGSARNVNDLSGRWAGADYADKINQILAAMNRGASANFSQPPAGQSALEPLENESPPSAPPGGVPPGSAPQSGSGQPESSAADSVPATVIKAERIKNRP